MWTLSVRSRTAPWPGSTAAAQPQYASRSASCTGISSGQGRRLSARAQEAADSSVVASSSSYSGEAWGGANRAEGVERNHGRRLLARAQDAADSSVVASVISSSSNSKVKFGNR